LSSYRISEDDKGNNITKETTMAEQISDTTQSSSNNQEALEICASKSIRMIRPPDDKNHSINSCGSGASFQWGDCKDEC